MATHAAPMPATLHENGGLEGECPPEKIPYYVQNEVLRTG